MDIRRQVDKADIRKQDNKRAVKLVIKACLIRA